MLPQKETDKTNIETAPAVKDELEGILGATLTVDSIDSYAEDALNDLIDLVGRTTEAYSHQPTLSLGTKTETETAAFAYYGLGDVEAMLDHIADKANELRDIDSLISRAAIVDTIITPTDFAEPINPSGMGGEFQKKMTIPRLKTLLFILCNEFAIDLHDDEQLNIQKGLLGSDMMRKESYYLVTAPTIERTVLVCDEEGNATFVFDSAVLKESNISSVDLRELTKTDLNDLIADNPRMGKRIIFTDDFVYDVIAALGDKLVNTQHPASPQENIGKYLYPTPPEGYRSMTGIISLLGVNRHTFSKFVGELGPTLGETNLYKFGSMTLAGYSPEQQDIIRQHLEAKGLFSEQAPEGYLSIAGIFSRLGVGHHTVSKIISEHEATLGEARTYRFGSKLAIGYSPEQQDAIRQLLKEQGLLAPQAPEGYLSVGGIAQLLGVDRGSVNTVVEGLGATLGETELYKFKSMTVAGYSPEQQNIIRQYLDKKGIFAPEAPEGYLFMSSMTQILGVSKNTFHKVIGELGVSLGEVGIYKFKSMTVAGYSPEQQNIIRQYLDKKGLLAPQAPEGFLSTRGVAEIIGVAYTTVKRAVGELGAALGETELYKFSPKTAIGYSPEQQNIIRQYLDKKGIFAPEAPEGFLSLRSIAQLRGVARKTVSTVIDELGASLGATRLYKSGTNLAISYSPEQQDTIRQLLEEQGLLAPQAPEGYLSTRGLDQLLGVARSSVNTAVEGLGASLGETELYKFGPKSVIGYSPEQQEKIKKYLYEKRLRKIGRVGANDGSL